VEWPAILSPHRDKTIERMDTLHFSAKVVNSSNLAKVFM
jgi:hypothetical protein